MAKRACQAILIHGFPGKDQDPLEQLAAIASLCSACGVDVHGFRWAEGSFEGVKETLRMLRNHRATFAGTHAQKFETWLSGLLPTLQSDAPLTVIAYSLGGAIFLKWLLEIASDRDIDRLVLAVMIVSPHTFPTAMPFEQHPDRPVSVRERAIPVSGVLAKLAGSRTRLKVVLAGHDISVPSIYAAFPPAPEIEEICFPEATHLDILRNPELLRLIGGWLHSL